MNEVEGIGRESTRRRYFVPDGGLQRLIQAKV